MDRNTDEIIALHREKYGPPSSDSWMPASMQKGSDKLAFFWISFAVIAVALVAYFGYASG